MGWVVVVWGTWTVGSTIQKHFLFEPIHCITSSYLSYMIGKEAFPTTSILSFSRYWIAKAIPSSTLSRLIPLPIEVDPFPPALPPTALATSDDHSVATRPLEA